MKRLFDLDLPVAGASFDRDFRLWKPWELPGLFAVGPTLGADGTQPLTARAAKTGETVVAQAHGKYFEGASRGVMFSACEQGSGIAVPATLSTTGIVSLYNPQNSGYRLSLLRVSIGYISGTLGAGTIYHTINATPTAVAPTGSTITKRCCDLGSGVASVATCLSTTTVPSSDVAYRPFCSLFPELATTANAMQQLTEDVDGEICIEPGCSWGLQGVMGAGGTTPKITVGFVWEEIRIV